MEPTTTHSAAVMPRVSGGRPSAHLLSRSGELALLVDFDGELLHEVELGITVDGRRFGAGSTILSASERAVDESVTMATGKAAGENLVAHREIRYTLRDDESGRTWGMVLRIADDGVAFRYVLPDDSARVTLGPELTSLRFAGTDPVWTLEYQTWYETPRFSSTMQDLPAGNYGFPTLVQRGEAWLLLTEADIDGRSSGAHLRIVDGVAGVVAADATLDCSAGHKTPWRVLIMGELGTIVRSQLVDELAPASQVDASFVRPGRAAWSWWSSQYSGAYLEDQKRFTDFAAEQGWEHVLVDCGWDSTWVPELVSYASARGIQVHLWSSWSDLDGEEALRKLETWASWGVAGIKVDFMESESRERYHWYDAIIAETARVGLMVNFHGSVIPRGWARTHPHVVSYEGIRGAEYYVFYGDPLTAAHNVIQPFTRNVVGSMDYTPVTFSAPQRETSDAHELALSIVFESGITHFADDPDQYRSRPLAAAMLSEVAPRWDEIRLLSGHPDREAVIARRAGDRWFVGAIATGEPRTITVDLGSLGIRQPHGWFVVDGPDGSGLAELVTHQSQVTIPVVANGGFAGIVVDGTAPIRRATPTSVALLPVIEPAVAVIEPGDSLLVTSSTGISAPLGWSVREHGDGRWEVTSPADATPGAVAVLTARVPGGIGPDRIAHARVFLTPRPAQPLSDLAFVTARNAVGPVERDLSNGGGDPRDGGTPTVGGRTFTKAVGVSHDSLVEVPLTGDPTVVRGAVGIDDETPDSAAVAAIAVDDVEVFRAELEPGALHDFELTITGNSRLSFTTSARPDRAPAHVDWVDVVVDRVQ